MGGQPQDEQKVSMRHNWREKFFQNDERLAKKAERKSKANDDVADFLKSTTNKAQTRTNTEIPTPRIDTSTASRWPTAAQISQLSDSQHRERGQSSKGYLPDLAKRKKRKGLSVKFTIAEPDIIGEGGDDSDIPPREISRQRTKGPPPPPKRNTIVHGTDERLDVGNRPAPGIAHETPGQSMLNKEGFRPMPLLRAATGFDEHQGSPEGSRNLSSTDLAEYDSPPVSPLDEEASPLRSGPESPDSFTASLQAATKIEEERNPFVVADSPPSPPLGLDIEDSTPIMTRRLSSSPSRPPRVEPEPTTNHSLSPMPPPLLSHKVGSASPERLPSALTPGRPQQASQFMASPPHQATGFAVEPLTEDLSKQSQVLLSSAVPVTGDDALDDFTTRVEHYNSIFHLAAQASKPVGETAFAEWIRAGTWWFLKGRRELEMAIRTNSRSADRQSAQPRESDQPLQAYIDLAKARWIIKHITPQHPELRQFGNADLNAMISIVRKLGHEELAQSIEMHQAILANLRALTGSMKRNSLLPYHLERSPLAQGLDTSIWIQYPSFTPEIESLLSGTGSPSVILEKSSKLSNLSDIMLLSDTKRHFNFGKIFTNVMFRSNEKQSQEFILPCILSIMRERIDWQIQVAIASQSGLVNMSIQPNQKPGLVWSDVRWETGSHAMRIRLPRGFELYMKFTDNDFKTIWGMYDYMQKVEGRIQARPDEELLFDNILKEFQYVDPRPSKAFPPEPSKGCKLRLFEIKTTRSEGTGQRKLHRGYRLMVVTSPKVKTVSSISHVLGKNRPILFSYLRNGDGAPALLLKVPEDWGVSTMVMTFHNNDERTELYSLLNGTVIGSQEFCSESIPLKSFSMEGCSQTEGTSSSVYNALETFEWQQLRVFNKDPSNPDNQHVQTVLSENLRIHMDCRQGSITDRVNLGQSAILMRCYLADMARSRRIAIQFECPHAYRGQDFTACSRRLEYSSYRESTP